MADLIGVLGENTSVAVASHTAYTCQAGKAAKVKMFYRGQAGSGGTSTLSVAVNGLTIFTKGATIASHYIFSSRSNVMETGSVAPTGVDADTTVGPAPEEYYLSAGDLVTYTIGGEVFAAMSFQVVGAEVDIT